MDGGGRGEPDRTGDLAHRRREATRAQRRRDVVEDLDLAFGVVFGHWRLLVLHDTERCSMSRRDASSRYAASHVEDRRPDPPTDRIILRRWRDDDRAPFAAMNADPGSCATSRGGSTRRRATMIDGSKPDSRRTASGSGRSSAERRSFPGLHGPRALPTFEAPFTPAIEVGWRLARSPGATVTPPKPVAKPCVSASRNGTLAEILSLSARLNTPSHRGHGAARDATRDPLEDFATHPRVPRWRPAAPSHVPRTASGGPGIGRPRPNGADRAAVGSRGRVRSGLCERSRVP